MKRNKDVVYDEDVNYDELEKRNYDDTPGFDFYVCPKCGKEYLATFMTSENGETMCIDCWDKKYNR